nr:MAG TPA: hypothetical protein [Caudoviricetes sp.]
MLKTTPLSITGRGVFLFFSFSIKAFRMISYL